MTSDTKKKRKSRSPNRSVGPKRLRRQSTTLSIRSQQPDNDTHLSEARSAFRGDRDPYFPHEADRASSLPTSDDWALRVKVIASSTDRGNDVFKKAVQSLVKICFPQGVLDQLGVQVLEQHMREERAPQENIERMHEVFGAEMIHRVTWMLAEYLDTPAKVETGVQAVVAASASLHGDRLGHDILGDVTASLSRLREHGHTDSDDDGMLVNSEASGNECATAVMSEESSAPSWKEIKKKKKASEDDRTVGRHSAREDLMDDAAMDSEVPVAQPRQSAVKSARTPRTHRDNKISNSWGWDIDQANFVPSSTHELIAGAADLFVYHASPIAKAKLGATAKRKEIRCEMQSMLKEMPDTEYEKWVESFERLLDGDREMLVRPNIVPSFENRRHIEATPAPIDTRRCAQQAKADVQAVSSPVKKLKKSVSTPKQTSAHIKSEVGAGRSNARVRQDDVETTTTAIRLLSTEERDICPPVNSIDVSATQSLEGSRGFTTAPGIYVTGSTHPDRIRDAANVRARVKADQTPIVDLLWGLSNFTEAGQTFVVQTIMNGLNRRVSADSIGITRFEGSTLVQTKGDLRDVLLKLKFHKDFDDPDAQIRTISQYKLEPWIIANMGSFSELKGSAFIFTNMMPSSTPVVDLLSDPGKPLLFSEIPVIKECLMHKFRQRQITTSDDDQLGSKHLDREITLALRRKTPSDMVTRGLLDRVLRRTAYAHKDKFPDLKYSSLVKAWERLTGLKW